MKEITNTRYSKLFEFTQNTRVFAENESGDSFILTNDPNVTFDNLNIDDMGCLVNLASEIISPELPILVLTKQEVFGEVTTEIEIIRKNGKS